MKCESGFQVVFQRPAVLWFVGTEIFLREATRLTFGAGAEHLEGRAGFFKEENPDPSFITLHFSQYGQNCQTFL